MMRTKRARTGAAKSDRTLVSRSLLPTNVAAPLGPVTGVNGPDDAKETSTVKDVTQC